MLKPQERLLSYPWSSFGAYVAAPEHRPGWVRADRLLGEHGIQEDTAAGRQRFEQWMERRRAEATLELPARLRRETTLSVKDIAVRVGLGTSKGANANLRHYMRRSSAPGAGQGQLRIQAKPSRTKPNQSMG